jgi:hypothetical protein
MLEDQTGYKLLRIWKKDWKNSNLVVGPSLA